jgi:type I restriction enzyme S subunit
LEGLEVSEILLSEVQKDIFRLDSEPFQKINKTSFNNFETVQISEIAIFNPLKSEVSKLDENLSVSFIPMTSLGNGVINEKENGKISDFVKTGYTYFAENDILIAKITPCMEHGKCAIAKNLTNKIGFGSTEYNVFRINDKRFLKEYVFTYLNREIIRKQAANNMIGTSGRQRVPIAFYENLSIPVFDLNLQEKIKELIESSYSKREQSQTLYHQAEELLLETIGLKDFQPSQENKNIKSFSESFLTMGQLDAEYYQPKYEEIENRIKNYRNKYCKLKDIGKFKNGSLISDELYVNKGKRAYIRIKELSFNQPISDNDVIFIDDSFVSSNETTVCTNDFVFATIGNTIGKVNIIPEYYDGSFISNNTSRFRLYKTKYYFFYELLFRSIAVQEQIQREFTQTAQPKIGNESLENIIIPVIEKEIQHQIAALIEKSFYLCGESKRLLDEAKDMVEKEIEKNDKYFKNDK